jgi:hypothetical protein
MKNLYPLLILSCLFTSTILYTQHAPELFFRLTANEAAQLYHEVVPSPDSSYFHTPISEKQAKQETGHYLRVNLSGESYEASLYATNNIRVELLNSQHDFSLLVKDTLGNNLPAAQVFLNKRSVPFDPKTQNYHLKRAPKEGFLEVKIAQDIAYYKVEPTGRKISGLVTSYNRFKYTRIGGIVTFPFRFLGKPIKYLITNIRRGNWISPKEFFFRRKYRLLQGYIAFSQPVYRLGDTMRLKAFVASPKGRPLKRNLTFTIAERYLDDPALVQKISPEKPGSYIMEWPLMDTLTIDEDYSVAIAHPRHKKWMNLRSKFRLEEFELDEINYELKTTCTEFHRGEKCILQLSAKTTNGLSIPDAEAEIYLLANQIKDFNAERVVVPDTLWHNKVSLGVRGETQVVLPDSVIPAVSLTLNCKVKFLNSSGQMDILLKEISFFSNPNPLKLELGRNEIVATSSTSMVDSCDLYTYFEDNKIQRTRVLLPLKFALNPNIWKYELVNKTVTATLNLQYQSKYSSEVKVEGLRSADSVKIRIGNPRQLPIWYQVRTKNGLITEGFFKDSVLQWQYRDESPNIYYLNYQYLWGGTLSKFDKRFTYYPKILSIALEGPTQVLPGQTANFQVKVTKSNGRPGRGVDLSAGAINAQFGNKESFSTPQIGFRRQLPPRPSIEYVLRSTEEAKPLPITRFLYHTFHLEDSLYYQYRYTSQLLSLHRDSSIRRDSFYKTVAQFAPYLVKDGKMQPIYLIYANRLLTYYYDSQDSRPYSFAAAEGYNQIVVRARDCEYVLDSVYLRKGEKLELVINEDYWQKSNATPHLKKTPKPAYFTSEEKALINGSIFVIKNLSKGDSIFIWDTPQNIHFATFDGYNNDYKNYRIGPFPSNAFLVYLHMNHFKKSFKFEPHFTYDVSQDRERLFEYHVLPNTPSNPLLPKEMAQPKLGRFIISSKAVRMFSPISSRIAYDVIPKTESKNTGKYQFCFSNTALQNDSSRLMLIVIQNLASTETWILEPSTRYFSPLPTGNYALFLFNQRQEVFQKNIHVGRDTLLFENLGKSLGGLAQSTCLIEHTSAQNIVIKAALDSQMQL